MMEHMDDYFALLSADEKAIFTTIASYAFTLDYKAKRDKSKTLSYTFTHSNVKRLILRFSSSKGKPIIKLKFFASPYYSSFFQEAIRAVIEEYDYKYTGCYGCGKCNSTEGYRYKYPDGREYYRCGTELIELTDISNLPVPELLDLLKKQHDYYSSGLGKAVLVKV
ncbi:MAG: hypothetical protein EHM41_01195 [Chloroflexi bacterium]|nr:MAG: hypothetical protein EHM41_01195 [Chloroflexota bacterium]